MSTVLESRAARARGNAVGWRAETARPPRDRRRIAAGIVLLVVCGWLSGVLFLSARDRDEVVAVARPVERFSRLSAEDLRVARVATDGDVATVPVERMDDLVGRVAAVELTEGSLLGAGQMLPEDARLVGTDEAVVGAVLAPRDAPEDLRPGAEVTVVVRAGGGAGEAQTLPGRVRDVARVPGPDGDGSGDHRKVSLVVPAGPAPVASTAAAEGRLSIAVRGGR